jgi:general stress protein 26
MGDTKNLKNNAAVKKMRDLADKETCLFCTFGEDEGLRFRPMSTLEVDDNGHIWFFSDKNSDKDHEIEEYDKVYLLYSNPGKQHYLCVEGTAAVSRNQIKINELWTPLAKAWFKDGKDDPSITTIEVTPTKAHYWDTKHGKMVSMMKILASVVSGKTADDGVEGELKVR